MAMPMPMQSILYLFSGTTFMILLLTLHPNLADSITLESDIEILRSIIQSVDPNSISATSFLSTWNFANDPCENPGTHFLGVLCTIPEDNNSSHRVTEIDLEGDGLEGFLTPVIGNLTELTLLNLRTNKFRGPIPKSVINLKKLTRLILSDNFFSGTIPNGIDALKRLEIINLSDNRLSGSIPVNISNLRSLTYLSLSYNQFSGEIPDFTGLWKLTALDLSKNQLYGNLPDFPRSLRYLSLGHNLLSGHIFTINRLVNLRELDLSDNRLSGMIYQGVLTLPEVIHINVSSNRFTEIEVVDMSNRPSRLQTIEAQSNRLRGHLPMNLVTYDSLRDINLGHNLLSGEIPAEYGQRVGTTWRSLFLDYNMLGGSLPSRFRISSKGSKKIIRGSLAHNCLNCPTNNPVCRGGQRSPSECVNSR
ncbi:hypothetical protein BUALT_Bualt14G0020100 [Buddleja alternifolia]|uniref:Leucine-rich repeat-containing N-terminal plant-type domain-containing protein n=1 Tax=Buddleja alternifolia TaxID=168488 RepID=A0AAV6WKT4_9LAMI|nr:hypothetical protein BUALT_Bualt14G0020100 [Buddleja alternifolia]